jgi:hypothetical protein
MLLNPCYRRRQKKEAKIDVGLDNKQAVHKSALEHLTGSQDQSHQEK